MLFDTENWINITVIWSSFKPQRGNGQCGQRDPWCTYRSQAGDDHYLVIKMILMLFTSQNGKLSLLLLLWCPTGRRCDSTERWERVGGTELNRSSSFIIFLPIEQKWNLNDTLALVESWVEKTSSEKTSLTMFLGAVPWRLEGFARI